MALNTEALGIFQGDLIIRSALIEGLADLRRNPYLLDYVFASLPKDDLTADTYGQKEVDQAKKWFLATNIPVVLNIRIDEAKFPCLAIMLGESSEAENTLSDTHYQPQEDTAAVWPVLVGPFAITSYDAATGTVVIPSEIAAQLVVVPGMVLEDQVGKLYPILEIVDTTIFTIQPGIVADFGMAQIRSAQPSLVTALESLAFKESYVVGCFVQGEPVHLTYLHSIVVFILLRYKEKLLEGRSFERSTISSTDFRKNDSTEMENVFNRYVTVNGFVRNFWPKLTTPKIQSVVPVIQVADSGNVPNDTDPDDALWIGDLDTIGTKLS